MSLRQITQVFVQYQKARTQFVHSVSEYSARAQNVDTLHKCEALALLRPLLSDVNVTIQQTAAMALGRLASHCMSIAEAIVQQDILSRLIFAMETQNRFYKKSALFALRNVAKHSPSLAKAVVDAGGVESMVACLEDFDPGVKEGASWSLGYVARHDLSLAYAVIEAGAVPLLVLCLQEPETCVKQVAASALADISKHGLELAQTVVDAGAIPHLARTLSSSEPRLKRQGLSALYNLAKHSLPLSELVVEASVFPETLHMLDFPDEYVRRNAAILVREIVKHSPELAQLVVNAGGLGMLVHFVAQNQSSVRLPGILALGYIGAHSDPLAMALLASQGGKQLAQALQEEKEDHVLSATAWAIGQVGRHSAEHAREVALTGVFPALLQLYLSPRGSDDLKKQAKSALKLVLQMCVHLPSLDPLLRDAPPNILRHVLRQYVKMLPYDPIARRSFVESGALRKVQEIKAEPGTELMEQIKAVNMCFPEEVVKYYSPNYPQTLLERVEQYKPPRMDRMSFSAAVEHVPPPEDFTMDMEMDMPPSSSQQQQLSSSA